MSDVPPQEVPANRAYEESEVEYSLALCMRMGLGQWAALANNAAPWRTRTALGSIIVNSEHGSWLGTERGKRICAKYCGMNTADWLAAIRKLREEVLKKYTKYNTLAWNIKFSSNFLKLAEMSAKDLDEAQRVWARSSSAPPPGPLHGTEATARRNREGTVATLLRRELAPPNAHEDGNNLTTNAYRNKVCTNPWRLCNSRVPVDCSKNLCATCCRGLGVALLVVSNALGVGHAMPECLSNPMVCHSVGSARRPGHIPTPSHSWTSTCILQHQEVWPFSSS